MIKPRTQEEQAQHCHDTYGFTNPLTVRCNCDGCLGQLVLEKQSHKSKVPAKIFTEEEYSRDPGMVVRAATIQPVIVARADGTPRVVITIPVEEHEYLICNWCGCTYVAPVMEK